MSSFSVEFDTPLRNVEAVGSLFAITVEVDESERASEELVAVAKSIEGKIGEACSAISAQQQRVEQIALACAIETVRLLLGSFDELVERRVRQSISVALEESNQTTNIRIFVHDSCEESIKSWLRESIDLSVEVAIDGTLAVGDCRIDFGSTGMQAVLDSQLVLIQTRLKKAIKNGEIA